MNVSFAVTLTGVDRPGIVARVADRARAGGASWNESRFAHLAGRFAGVVLLDVPEAAAAELEQGLTALGSDDLHVLVERLESRPEVEGSRLELELIGQDRPGIVRDVSAVLARHGINIEELETEVVSASMSGELLFRAHASLVLPKGMHADALSEDLERLANELMVDIEVEGEEEDDDVEDEQSDREEDKEKRDV